MRPLRRFVRDRRGVAGVEFVMLFPVLLVMILVGTQVASYINAARKVERISNSIAQMLAEAAPPSDNSTTVATVNSGDLNFGIDSAMLIFPYVFKDRLRTGGVWYGNLRIGMASVQFAQKPGICNNPADLSGCYTANVVWSFNYGMPRPCGVPLTPVADTDPPSATTLPRSVYGPGSVVVVDVTFDFTPMFGENVLPHIVIRRSTYLQPRSASRVSFDTVHSDGSATLCPGY